MITFGHLCPVTDLFVVAGREPADRLGGSAAVARNDRRQPELIDDLERQIARPTTERRAGWRRPRYVPLLLTVPGLAGWSAFTIAAEIGDITRLPSPKKLRAYTGRACARTSPVSVIAAAATKQAQTLALGATC